MLEQQDVDVLGVFFYQDGVANANTQLQTAGDEFNAQKQWQQLHQNQNLALHLCITAAEKRGLTDNTAFTSNFSEIAAINNIAPIFTVSGLAELASLMAQADRTIQL